MTSDRSPQPSKEAWEGRKDIIRRRYLIENRTCGDIQKELAALGFKVSERQIKNRLSEWKLERKKTPHQHYMAMLVVAECYKAGGFEVEFDVPKREERAIYTTQKVKKECERVRKRYTKCPEPFRLPSLYEARHILDMAEIYWREKHLMVQPTWVGPVRLSDGILSWNLPPELAYRTCLPNTDGDVNAQDGNHVACLQVRQEADRSVIGQFTTAFSSGKHQDWPACYGPQPNEDVRMTDTPASTGAAHSFQSVKNEHTPRRPCAFGVFASSQQDVPFQGTSLQAVSFATFRKVGVESPSPPPMRPMLFKQEDDQRPPFDCPVGGDRTSPGSPFYKKSTSNFSMCRSCSPPHAHSDFDFIDSIDSLEYPSNAVKIEPSDHQNLADNTFPDEDSCAEDHKLTASRWAAPYYMQCLSDDVQEAALQRSLARSMQALEYALGHNNEFILPCLSWTILVLGQNQKMRELADLLYTSCSLINKQCNISNSLSYAVPFRYAHAWASNNLEGMNLFGGRLEGSHAEIRYIWGKNHPNFFVSGYLYAWHLVRKQDYARAIELLTENLPVCARKMGRHDLLTISCLTVISRAHAEMGNLQEAVRYCREAMLATQLLEVIEKDQHHVKVHRPVLQRFRLELLARHAALIYHLHDHINAEKQLWRVLHIRGQLCGLKSGDTWEAAWHLGPVLQSKGQGKTWDGLMNFIIEGYKWMNERDWYIKKGKKLPDPPVAPPCWWPFKFEKDAKAEGHPSMRDEDFYRSSMPEGFSQERVQAAFASMAHLSVV